MEVALPKYAAFKHIEHSLYLEYLHEGSKAGSLNYSSKNLVSVYTKFAIEPAKAGRRLVNIRCCYNNKYLASSNNYLRIVTPFVDKPQEDNNIWPCTLFEVQDIVSKGIYKLLDVRHQTYVIYDYNLRACDDGSDDQYIAKFHKIIDFETILVLPKHVAFKGDNEKYLTLARYSGDPYLEFSSDDIGHPNVSHEVFTMSDGSLRFKSKATGKFWICESSNWIQPHSGDKTGADTNTYFWPVKVSKNIVALRSVRNNNYCKRLTAEGKTSCLSTAFGSITEEAHLEVVEPIISREIYNVSFRPNDGRIRDQKILTLATADTSNGGTEAVNVAVQFKYTDTKSKSWNSSLTLSLDIITSIEAGVPLIGNGKIEIKESFTASYSWGETLTKSEEVGATYTVNVPPKTRLKVSLVATNAKCDVPFSYTKRDTLRTGEQVITLCDDGIYVGENSYHFDYKSVSTPI